MTYLDRGLVARETEPAGTGRGLVDDEDDGSDLDRVPAGAGFSGVIDVRAQPFLPSSNDSSGAHRIVLVEEDAHTGDRLQQALTREGHQVEWVSVTEAAVKSAMVQTPDLILLSLRLPMSDPFAVCRGLRVEFDVVPIIILSGPCEEIDVVSGLDAGADDYVVMPFRLAELLARVRAQLRRPTRPPCAEVMQLGNVELNMAARRALVADRGDLALRPKEFELLACLMGHQERVVSGAQLSREVWNSRSNATAKSLAVLVGSLRRKLLVAGATARITTIRGAGYRLDSTDPAAPAPAGRGTDR